MSLHYQWHSARMEDCHLISIISTINQNSSFSLFYEHYQQKSVWPDFLAQKGFFLVFYKHYLCLAKALTKKFLCIKNESDKNYLPQGKVVGQVYTQNLSPERVARVSGVNFAYKPIGTLHRDPSQTILAQRMYSLSQVTTPAGEKKGKKRK